MAIELQTSPIRIILFGLFSYLTLLFAWGIARE